MSELNGSNTIINNLSLDAHIGHQKVKNNSRFDYTVWSVGTCNSLACFGTGTIGGSPVVLSVGNSF